MCTNFFSVITRKICMCVLTETKTEYLLNDGGNEPLMSACMSINYKNKTDVKPSHMLIT